MFNVAGNRWTGLPDMREARAYFNPCLFRGAIYLCGNGSKMMEVFDPETNAIKTLQMTLPESASCCLYVDNDMLVVHSKSYILKYAVRPDGQLAEPTTVRSRAIDKYQNSQPIVDQAKRVFFLINEGNCISFTMETGDQDEQVALA